MKRAIPALPYDFNHIEIGGKSYASDELRDIWIKPQEDGNVKLILGIGSSFKGKENSVELTPSDAEDVFYGLGLRVAWTMANLREPVKFPGEGILMHRPAMECDFGDTIITFSAAWGPDKQADTGFMFPLDQFRSFTPHKKGEEFTSGWEFPQHLWRRDLSDLRTARGLRRIALHPTTIRLFTALNDTVGAFRIELLEAKGLSDNDDVPSSPPTTKMPQVVATRSAPSFPVG